MEDQILIMVIIAIGGIVSLIRKANETEKKKNQEKESPVEVNEPELEDGYRLCSHCRTVNLEEARTCFGCGMPFAPLPKKKQVVRKEEIKTLSVAPVPENHSLTEDSQMRLQSAMEHTLEVPQEEEGAFASEMEQSPFEHTDYSLDTEYQEEDKPFLDRLDDIEGLRDSIILKEILEKPVSLRKKA